MFLMVDVDPSNKKNLPYDEFFKNLGQVVKLSHPEAYIIFKHCINQGKL